LSSFVSVQVSLAIPFPFLISTLSFRFPQFPKDPFFAVYARRTCPSLDLPLYNFPSSFPLPVLLFLLSSIVVGNSFSVSPSPQDFGRFGPNHGFALTDPPPPNLCCSERLALVLFYPSGSCMFSQFYFSSPLCLPLFLSGPPLPSPLNFCDELPARSLTPLTFHSSSGAPNLWSLNPSIFPQPVVPPFFELGFSPQSPFLLVNGNVLVGTWTGLLRVLRSGNPLLSASFPSFRVFAAVTYDSPPFSFVSLAMSELKVIFSIICLRDSLLYHGLCSGLLLALSFAIDIFEANAFSFNSGKCKLPGQFPTLPPRFFVLLYAVFIFPSLKPFLSQA